MNAWAVLLTTAAALAVPPPEDHHDLVWRDGDDAMRIQVWCKIDGKTASSAWKQFLERVFEFYDANHDGVLDRAEQALVLPLPCAAKGKLAWRRLAIAGDKSLNRQDFLEECTRQGFGPVVVVHEHLPADTRRLGQVLFSLLDRDGDGQLSRQELAEAPALLRRFDENDDEILTPKELLKGAETESRSAVHPPGPPLPVGGTKLSSPPLEGGAGGVSPTIVRLTSEPQFFGGWKQELVSVAVDASGVRWTSPGMFTLERYRLDFLGFRRCMLSFADASAAAFTSSGQTRQFYLSQARIALGNRPYLDKEAVARDPSVGFLKELFDSIDRDGDGKLTRTKIDGFWQLLELFDHGQIVLAVMDPEQNLWSFLDRDGDGRLSLAELRRAVELLPDDGKPLLHLTRADLPFVANVRVQAEAHLSLLGAAPAVRPLTGARAPARGPAWFQKMDRNGDGLLSPREFLGSPDLFRQLDRNGDGFISIEEAEATEKK